MNSGTKKRDTYRTPLYPEVLNQIKSLETIFQNYKEQLDYLHITNRIGFLPLCTFLLVVCLYVRKQYLQNHNYLKD